MDPATRKVLKARLLRDVEQPGELDPRRFADIVKNAADIDTKYLYKLMGSFGASHGDVRAWGTGAVVPEDARCVEIVEKIHEMLEEDLNA